MDSKFNDVVTSNNDASDRSKTTAVGFPCADYDDNDDDNADNVNRGKNNTYDEGGGNNTNITIINDANDDNNNNNNNNNINDNNKSSNSNSNSNSNSDDDTNITHTTISAEDDHMLYPADCYSFLSLYGPRLNLGFFSFGLMVYLFQITFLILMILSKIHKKLSANGEVDNPSGDLIANFIHSNASYLVRATQFTALLSYVLFADASLQDVVKAVETFPRFDRSTKTDKVGCMVFSCTLRFTQGALATAAALLLVVTSSEVIDIVLNFTAINFISALDDVAFELAKWGKYGKKFEVEAKRIEQLPLPSCMVRTHKHVRSMYTIGIFGLVLMSLLGAIIYAQENQELWLTKTLRVEFQDSHLKSYSGCYDIDEDAMGRLEGTKRNVYKISGESTDDTAKFGYCKADRRWYLFTGSGNNACDANENKLAHSSKTDTFDISSSYGESWSSVSGTPLDLYFIELDKTLDDICESWDDGTCDPIFNTIDFRYDGGDCCSATCTESACGIDDITEAFGVVSNGDGFPYCMDPFMRPLTLTISAVISSREYELKTWSSDDVMNRKYADVNDVLDNIDEFVLDYKNTTGNEDIEVNDMIEYFSEDPVMPPLLLDCDGKNVLSININKSMTNGSQTVWVQDGAECILIIKNSTSAYFSENKENDPIWYVNYTIFHDDKRDIQILQGFSGETKTVNFNRMPDCAVDVLLNYVDKKSLSNDVSRKTIDWMMSDKLAYLVCENAFFIEKYALGVLNFAAPIKASDDLMGLWVEDDARRCMWPSITCERGSVVKLGLDSSELTGSIPPEIALLSNLVEYIPYNNSLTGKIPSEIGSLTKMERLSLASNDLSGKIPSEIGLLTAMTRLSLTSNMLSGKMPSEMLLLTGLIRLSLTSNDLSGLISSEIGSLTALTRLSLADNMLTGKIPSEIGTLTAITRLSFSSNFLTESIPSEIGLLTSLFDIHLDSNKLTGSIPSEIGLLTSLHDIQLASNFLTGFLPSEIGLLTSLEFIDLANNRLSGTLPSELLNVKSIKKIGFYNTSIDRDSIPISLLPYIVEPCIICDGEGSFDYVKSIDENVISWSDECSKNINDIKNDEIYEMLMVDECNLLMERCVVCHDKTTTTNSSTSIDDKINRN